MLKKDIEKYALHNAVKYGGKANAGAVIGKLLSEKPELKGIITKDTILICLAGSRNGEDCALYSDYDFFILTKNTDKTLILTKKGEPTLECFYYSLKRMDNCIKEGDSIAIDAFFTGKTIFIQDNPLAKRMLEKISKAYSNFKPTPLLLGKIRYRVAMLIQKFTPAAHDEQYVKLLASYYLEDIVRILFYLNGRVHPSVRQLPAELLRLKVLPEGFSDKFKIISSIYSARADEVRKAMLDILAFIQEKAGKPEGRFKFIPLKTESTKVF